MKDILIELLGQPPAGFEFMFYIFGFILILAGLYLVYSCFRAVMELFY